jgi:hypothetical protein
LTESNSPKLQVTTRNFANVHNGFGEFSFSTGGNWRQLATLCFSAWGCKNGMQKSFQEQEMVFGRFQRWTRDGASPFAVNLTESFYCRTATASLYEEHGKKRKTNTKHSFVSL